MKVLYFYQYFATPAGSWGTRAYEFASRWVKQGHEVVIVTGIYDKSDLEEAEGLVRRTLIDGIDVRVVNVTFSNKHGLLRRAYSFLAYAGVSVWFALTEKADVTLASSGPITTAFPAMIARALRGIPMVLEVRDLWPDVLVEMGLLRSRFSRWLARTVVKVCYRFSSHIVVLSPGMKEWVLRDYGALPVSVVTNAADIELFDAPPKSSADLPAWSAESHLALFTGTMGAANSCEQLVQGAAELHERGRRDIGIVLIGDGSERNRLEADAAERGLGNVRFIDPMPKENLVAWMRRARVLLLVLKPIPVFDTSSPNKLFDALASGRPILQTTQGWIKDLLAEEGCGLTVRPFDAAAFADALEQLCDDDDLHGRMAAAARATADRYERSLLARRMLDVLEHVGEKRALPPPSSDTE